MALVSSVESSWFLGENGSIDGGISKTEDIPASTIGEKRLPREDERRRRPVGRGIAAGNFPEPVSVRWFRGVGADVASPDDSGAPLAALGGGQSGRLRIVDGSPGPRARLRAPAGPRSARITAFVVAMLVLAQRPSITPPRRTGGCEGVW